MSTKESRESIKMCVNDFLLLYYSTLKLGTNEQLRANKICSL